jgi:hypothetical protein
MVDWAISMPEDGSLAFAARSDGRRRRTFHGIHGVVDRMQGPACLPDRFGDEHTELHDRALAHVASGGPYNFARAVLRVDQYYCLGRQSLRRSSPPGGEVALKDIYRVGAGFGGKRAPEEIYPPTRVTRRITGVPAELRGAEVPRSTHRAGKGQSSCRA